MRSVFKRFFYAFRENEKNKQRLLKKWTGFWSAEHWSVHLISNNVFASPTT